MVVGAIYISTSEKGIQMVNDKSLIRDEPTILLGCLCIVAGIAFFIFAGIFFVTQSEETAKAIEKAIVDENMDRELTKSGSQNRASKEEVRKNMNYKQDLIEAKNDLKGDGQKAVKVSILGNGQMKILCNLTNIDTFPDFLIYLELAILMIILLMATLTSAPGFSPEVPNNATLTNNDAIVLSSSNIFLSVDTVYIIHKTVEQGYFFVILITLAAFILSDRSNVMQILFSIGGALMCFCLGLLRLIKTANLDYQGPFLGTKDININTTKPSIATTVSSFNAYAYAAEDDQKSDEIKPRSPVGKKIFKTLSFGTKNAIQESIDSPFFNPGNHEDEDELNKDLGMDQGMDKESHLLQEFQFAMQLSYAMGVLLLVLSILFVMDAFFRIRRDCYKVRNNLGALTKMPSILMIPKLVRKYFDSPCFLSIIS